MPRLALGFPATPSSRLSLLRLVRFPCTSPGLKGIMPLAPVETPWVKFGTCRDLALVGRDAIAMASGIYARFYDCKSGTSRVERFEGGERGDGVCCLAGLSAAPIFSVAERKANPRISVFAYPAMRRISCCAESEQAIGYLCCAFAGTEYLLGQTTFPDFRLILWQWRSGQRLATVDATDAAAFGVDGARIACSSDSARLVARLAESSGALAVYRVVACSNTVRLFPIEPRSTRAPRPVSCSWSAEGTLLCCDESGTVWSVDFETEEEDRRAEIIVQGSRENRSERNPLVVGHAGGALVVDLSPAAGVRATFYRKAWNDRKEGWRASWTTRVASYPRHAESDPRQDRILMLGEDGDLYEMQGASRDHPPRLELLLRGDARYASIAPLSDSHLAAFDQTDRLAILHAATGNLVSRPNRVSHHGKVADLASHPALPILASCTASGSFLLVEAAVPSRPRIAGCAHLQRQPLDRVKFSDRGRVVGVAAAETGRLFLVLPNLAFGEAEPASPVRVAACLNPRRKLIDFLVYETGERGTAKAVLLLGSTDSSDHRAGNELAVYSCDFSDRDDLREHADHAIKLGRSFESVHYGKERSRDAIGVPWLTKQLHRIELREDFREARLSGALPSLHQTRGIRVGVCEGSLLLTYGFDGLVVLRESAELRRVSAVLVAHHRSQAGVGSAVLVDNAVVSLGRNGDLVANRLPYRLVARRASRSTSSADWIALRTRGANMLEGTWMDERISQRNAAEESRSLASRVSVLRDWSQLKQQVKALLDWNEAMPAAVRLPVSAFDLDGEARERELEEAKARAERSLREAEERIARQQRSSRYLRQRFLDPLIVPPRSIFSFFGRLKVANYPLVKLTPVETNFLSWCRVSMETRQLVSRLEGEEIPRIRKLEYPWDRWHGFSDAFEACAIAEQHERHSRAAFNERFEEMRSAKKVENRAAIERANETRRLVLELRDAFRVDASSSLLRVPRCHPTEAIESAPNPSLDSVDGAQPEQRESEQARPVEETFPREALEKMMDGVLEVRLEDSAKRNVRKPDCLLRKDPSSYTEADVRAIETYERKVRARRIDRQKYKSLLETEIERLKGEFYASLRAFDDEVRELAAEKIRVERSIVSQRLLGVQAVLRHRNIVRERRNVDLAVRLQLVPAAQQARSLAETCDLFEAAVLELRIDFENARKRDKLLEGKFRQEYVESKASTSTSEHLLRQYRKRPKLLTAACSTSVTFLLELAACAIDRRTSDALPAECCCYLRALNQLDESSERLLSRLEVDHWSSLCRLRRLKVEAEIKAKCCAIQLAEAEQSLAFLRNARATARAAASRRRQEIEHLEERLPDLAADREISLLLKAGQLRIRAEGCPRSDWQRAVLVPRGELERANRAIAEALEQRSLAQRRLADIREVVSLQEWRHARDKARMRDLRDRARELDRSKVSRVARECCQPSGRETTPEQQSQRIRSALHARREIGEEAVERERARWRRVAAETRNWRRRNADSTRKIDRSKAERDDLVIAARSPLRARVAAFKRRKIRAIRTKAHLVRQVQDHSQQLSILESRLEISKLRTYPTLRFKF